MNKNIIALVIIVAIIVIGLIIFIPKSSTVVQNSEVQSFSVKLEKAHEEIQEYSAHVVVKGFDGKTTKEYDYYFKEPGKRKFVWTTPNPSIDVYEGEVHYQYKTSTNTLFISNVPTEDITIIDFIEALKNYLETHKADVEEIYYNEKETYKLTIYPNDDKTEGSTIYYVDKETMWPVKVEYFTAEERCEILKEFYNTYTDKTLTSCVKSEEFQDPKFTGLNDELFEIRNDIPEDAKEKSGPGGECNPVYETARPLEEASFQVYAPTYVPERATINYPPKEIPNMVEEGGPGNCKRSIYSNYANVHTAKTWGSISGDEEIEVAQINININTRVDYNEDYYIFHGGGTLTQSRSVLIWEFLASDKPEESKTIDLDGIEATFNEYNSQYTGKNILFWKANGLYFVLESLNEEGLKIRNGAGGNFPDEPIETILTEEEMIEIALSLIPL